MKTIKLNIDIEFYKKEELDAKSAELVEKAIEATENSYAPYSNFRVGACVRLDDGTTIIGANQENAAYPDGLCAERTAVFAAQVQYPNLPIAEIAIAARNTKGELLSKPISPCGSCRQVLLEIEQRYNRNIRILLYGTSGVYAVKTVKDLLPLCFISNDMWD